MEHYENLLNSIATTLTTDSANDGVAKILNEMISKSPYFKANQQSAAESGDNAAQSCDGGGGATPTNVEGDPVDRTGFGFGPAAGPPTLPSAAPSGKGNKSTQPESAGRPY